MIDTDPSDFDATESSQRLIASGHGLEDAGDVAGALTMYEQAVASAPTHIRAYLNLGNALQRLGRNTEAVAALQAALRIAPDSAPCHFNLGNVYLGAGNFDAAIHALRGAIRLDPAMAQAAVTLANVLELQQRPHEAEKALSDVLAARPEFVPAAYNLALLLQKRNDIDEAERLLRRCMDEDPTFMLAAIALGDLTRNTRRAREAEGWYRRALGANPRSLEGWSGLLLSLNNRDDLSPADVFAEHLRFGATFPEHTPSHKLRPDRGRAGARIRVGYLSGDLMQHPVALFLRPVLAHHDRMQFEIFCYSNNARDDWMTQEIRTRVDHWRNIANRDDATVASDIRADELDILIDLSGHSARSRILLFNYGCAPVQATWLGYLNTTGLRSADFRICDGHSDPAGMTEQLHTEQLVRLPDSQWCYCPVLDFPELPMPQRELPGHVVFGSFNHASKLSERCVDLWCRVLDAVPASYLRIVNIPPGRTTEVLRKQIEQRGIASDRISIVPGMNIDEYFAAIGRVDVALDSFPYNGGTTTLDILWMGVPLVALAGDRSVSRSGVSILSVLQIPELIAGSDDDYVALNSRLAADREWRRTLRTSLRPRLQRSLLMDAARFTRNLEAAFRKMLEQK